MVILTPGFPEIDIDERSGSDKPYVLSETAFTLTPVELVSRVDSRYRNLGFINAHDHFEVGDSAVMKNNIETAYKIGPEFVLGVYCRELELPNAFSLQQHHFREDLTSGLEVAVHGLEVLNTQLMDELVAAAENIKQFQTEKIPEEKEDRVRYAMRATALQRKFQEARALSRIFAHYEDYKKGKREDRIALFNFPEYDRVCRATLSPNNMSALSRFAGTIRYSRNYPGERKAFPDDAQTLFDSTKLPIVGYQSFFKKVIEDSLKQINARRKARVQSYNRHISQQVELTDAFISRRTQHLAFQGNIAQDVLDKEGHYVEEWAVVASQDDPSTIQKMYSSHGFREVDFDTNSLEKMLNSRNPTNGTFPGMLAGLAKKRSIDLEGMNVQVYVRQSLSNNSTQPSILELDCTNDCPLVLRAISTYEISDLVKLPSLHQKVDDSLQKVKDSFDKKEQVSSSITNELRRQRGNVLKQVEGARRFGYSQIDQFGEITDRHIAFSVQGIKSRLYSLDENPKQSPFFRGVRVVPNSTRTLSEVDVSELWEGTGLPRHYKNTLFPIIEKGQRHFIDVVQPEELQRRERFASQRRTPALVEQTISTIKRTKEIRKNAEEEENK